MKIIFFVVFLILNFNNAQCQIIHQFKVGDVLYSILPPIYFINEHGSGWVVLDSNQSLEGKLLQKIIDDNALPIRKLPSSYNNFVRNVTSINHHNDCDYDEESINSCIYQADCFQYHYHNLFGWNGINNGGTDIHYGSNSSQYGLSFAEYNDGNSQRVYYQTSTNDNMPIGSGETRPKNIKLYLYIKID